MVTKRHARAPASDARVLRDYRAALVAEFDQFLAPAVVERVRGGAAALPPRELAKRMLAVAPAPAPLNPMAEQVGPTYYDTAGVSVVLAEPGAAPVSKQAVEHRRRRNTVLALPTSDNRWIYPTWQFQDGEVMSGLVELLRVFQGHPAWSIATWLTTPSAELDGRTAVQWLRRGQAPEQLMTVARHTAARWAA